MVFREKGPGRTPDRVIATDAKGNEYVLPLDLPDVAEELAAHIRRLLDDGDELVIIRAERTQSLREELAETQARLVMLQAQLVAIEEHRDDLRGELARKEAQLSEVQRALATVGAALEDVHAEDRPSPTGQRTAAGSTRDTPQT